MAGEIAAAYAARKLSAADAIVTAYARGDTVRHNKIKGAMMAVGVGADTVAPYLEEFHNVRIACHNSPESLTLSGNSNEIMTLKDVFAAESIFARPLQTGGNAYHSHHMKPLGPLYEANLNDMLSVFPHTEDGHGDSSDVDFVSSVTGELYPKQGLDASYWRRNLESPVLFNQAATCLCQTKQVDMLVEIGPHAAMQAPFRLIFQKLAEAKSPQYVPTLMRKQNGAQCVLQTAGTLFAKGYEVDLERVNTVEALDACNRISSLKLGKTIVDLPKYQWQYNDLLYFENRWTREWRLKSHPRHDILGSRSPGGNANEPLWRNVLRSKDLPWLQHHKVKQDNLAFTASDNADTYSIDRR